MNRLLAILIAVASSIVFAAPSSAQRPGWLADRSRAQGPGFRVGNLELHPGFGAEVGYDSNVFYEDTDDGPRDPAGSAIFRFTPHLLLSTISEQRQSEGEGEESDGQMVQFQAGVSGQAYIFLENEARNNFSLNADLDLNINPKGRFGFRFYNNFARTIRPFTGRVGAGKRNYAIDDNRVGVQLFGRSRGGVLSTSVGYQFRFRYFEETDFRYANSFGHQITADTHFKFLPSTSLFWDMTLDLSDYYNTNPGVDPIDLANNWRLRTRIGLNGVITPKVSATVAVGYAANFVDDPAFSDFDTILALVGLKFRLTPTATLDLGFERENTASIVGLYRTQDRGYLNFELIVGRAFLIGLNTWVARLEFGDIVAGGTPSGGRSDIYLSAKLFAEYRFTDWLGLNASVGYFGDFTDFEYQVSDGAGGLIPDPAGFNKFEAWLGLRVFY